MPVLVPPCLACPNYFLYHGHSLCIKRLEKNLWCARDRGLARAPPTAKYKGSGVVEPATVGWGNQPPGRVHLCLRHYIL